MPGGTPPLDPTERFALRADAYAAARPTYPAGIVELLMRELALPQDATVADLGSGTGLSSRIFLQAGLRVFAIEPNAAMRAQAEQALAGRPGFTSIAGQAQATTLPDASVDCVVAAQAFHWFDRHAARIECLRILRQPPRAALIWNVRHNQGSEFLRGYEQLLARFGRDYSQVRDRHLDEGAIQDFFGGPHWRRHDFAHATELDFDTLAALAQSASYLPAPQEPDFGAMMRALRQLFDATARDGRVAMQYDARVYFGLLHPPAP